MVLLEAEFNLKEFPVSLLRGCRYGIPKGTAFPLVKGGVNTPTAKSACGAVERRRRKFICVAVLQCMLVSNLKYSSQRRRLTVCIRFNQQVCSALKGVDSYGNERRGHCRDSESAGKASG